MQAKMRYVNCSLCSSRNYSILYKAGNSSVVKCKNCSFVYLNPAPTERALKEYYTHLPSSEIAPLDVSPVEYNRSLERLESLEKIFKPGRILDVGAGGSNFLLIARERGWNTYSTDIRSEVIRLLQRHSIKTINEKRIADGFFDAITLTQVLEHMTTPLARLRFYYRKLAKKGIIIIEVPNFESLGARLLRGKWYFIKNPEHLSYFSKTTLTAMLKRAGFEIIKVEFLGATLVTDFASGGKANKQIVFALYKYLSAPIGLITKILGGMGLSDTLRIVARKPDGRTAVPR